jgi:hypothetical protein
MLQPAPAIHQHEGRDGYVPDGVRKERKPDERRHSYKSDDGCDHQTSPAPDHEPEQRSKNLAAV